jgi:large subunit ribosomal protein L15
MAITLHQLAAKRGARTRVKRLGRGQGSGRGKTAGKGTKGQRARTGGRKALKLKGMKQMLLSFPKNRGFQSRYAKDAVVRIERLSVFADGSRVALADLKTAGLIGRAARSVKILAGGSLAKKLTHAPDVTISSAAKTEIERAGGTCAK